MLISILPLNEQQGWGWRLPLLLWLGVQMLDKSSNAGHFSATFPRHQDHGSGASWPIASTASGPSGPVSGYSWEGEVGGTFLQQQDCQATLKGMVGPYWHLGTCWSWPPPPGIMASSYRHDVNLTSWDAVGTRFKLGRNFH